MDVSTSQGEPQTQKKKWSTHLYLSFLGENIICKMQITVQNWGQGFFKISEYKKMACQPLKSLKNRRRKPPYPTKHNVSASVVEYPVISLQAQH